MIEYSAFNTDVFSKIPVNALSILDVGCGTGIMGKALKDQKKERKVSGVTYSNEEFKVATQVLDKVWVTDINKGLPNFTNKYDCIIFSHILEHTFHPDQVLADFCSVLNKDGIVIIALPNILHFKQRLQFMSGNFKYSETGGLMDVTHFRFFDWNTSREMIIKAGLKIVTQEANGNFPFPFIRKFLPSICKAFDAFSLKIWPGLFGFQFVYTAIKI